MDTILYKDKEYPYRTITIKVEDSTITINVSIESLSEEIYRNNEEACSVDNEIGYYVPDDVINLNEKELIRYVEENYI